MEDNGTRAAATPELYINNKDARAEYGVILGNGSMASLICPGPAKAYVTNESRAENGKEYQTSNTRIEERQLNITIYIIATSYTDLYTKLSKLSKDVFETGVVNIKTKYQTGVVYHCIYKGCQQLTELNGRLARFSLQLVETDPTNRR